MTAEQEPRSRPWEDLEQITESGNVEQLEEYIEALPSGEIARALTHLDAESRARVLRSLPTDDAADLINELPDAQAADLIRQVPAETAATILEEMPSEEQADLLTELREGPAEAILAAMDPARAEDLRTLAAYPNDEAGGLMAIEFLAFPQDAAVGEVVGDLRRRAGEFADDEVQYVYVAAPDGPLVGVLRLRDLLFAPDTRSVSSIMIRNPLTVSIDTPLDELAEIFDTHAFLGVPVVDDAGILRGVVHRAAVEEARGDRAESEHLKSRGIIGGEELRTMPLRVRAARRLSWLSVNIVLNIIAASVIALYMDTLASVIALAVFLPIISDMSGCSGNQAVAVSMRELTLGLVKPYELVQVWLKEIGVGVLNGLVLGALIALVAWLWKGNPYLGLVVGSALALNTMVAVSLGGTVPLLLKRMRVDPAIASGPILTTVTDMCGFFLTLSFAALMMPHLSV